MTVTILVGDTRERLKEIPDGSIQCVVTSPPYYGLRDYNVAGQIGLEPTLSGYIAALVDVFRDVRRVLRPDGVAFLNLGDSYANGGGATQPHRDSNGGIGRAGTRGQQPYHAAGGGFVRPSSVGDGLKPKDLMMVPARVAIALQDDGWWLRSHIIWAKKAPMPESVTDRPTSAHESIFLLTKSARYFWDQEAVREENSGGVPWGANVTDDKKASVAVGGVGATSMHRSMTYEEKLRYSTNGRNIRNVWHLGPDPYPGAHFAVMPREIPRRCIKAGTSEKGCCAACGAPWVRVVERKTAEPARVGNWKSTGADHRNDIDRKGGFYDQSSVTTGWQPGCTCEAEVIPCTVLDPFLGSGTTALVSDQLDRNCIGIELNAEYAAQARERIFGDAPLFATVDVA